ncbi:MAG TPA: hypothetical protein PLV07_06855, partial [Acidiphilium sp.]|nr:hypothetical protein [Acidiphilium sp.]
MDDMKKKQTNNIKNTNRDESKDEQVLPPGDAGGRGGDVAPAASSGEAAVRRPLGYLERCDHEIISGWIWDPE